MTHLLNALTSPVLHRAVKPSLLSCIGYIAASIDEDFKKYLPYVIPMLQGAAVRCARLDHEDEGLVDLRNLLSRGIFKACSGILQGFKNKAEVVMPFAHSLLQFIEAVFKDKQMDNEVTKAGVALIGDLVSALGTNMKTLLNDFKFCGEFLNECLESSDDRLKESAIWTRKMILRALVARS